MPTADPLPWRFALSSARAVLWLPPADGWPMLALVAGVVVASAAAAGPAVGAAVPGLRVFAVTFTGLVGAMVVLAVTRSRRPRLRLPAPTVLVTGGVAASIAVTGMEPRSRSCSCSGCPRGCVVTRSTAGCSFDGEVVAPVGVNLADALAFCLGIFPVLGLTLAVIGAGLGARTTRRAVPNDPAWYASRGS